MLLVDLGLGCLQRLEGVLDAVVVSMLVDSRAAQRVTEREVQHQRCAAVFAAARRDDKEITAVLAEASQRNPFGNTTGHPKDSRDRLRHHVVPNRPRRLEARTAQRMV